MSQQMNHTIWQRYTVNADSLDAVIGDGGYAAVLANKNKRDAHQDYLDSVFSQRVVDIRNALRDQGWQDTEGTDHRLLRDTESMVSSDMSGLLEIEHQVTAHGAGANVVAVDWTARRAARDGTDTVSMTVRDTLACDSTSFATALTEYARQIPAMVTRAAQGLPLDTASPDEATATVFVELDRGLPVGAITASGRPVNVVVFDYDVQSDHDTDIAQVPTATGNLTQAIVTELHARHDPSLANEWDKAAYAALDTSNTPTEPTP